MVSGQTRRAWNSSLPARRKPIGHSVNFLKNNGIKQRKGALKKVSKKQSGRLARYYPIRDAFLAENRACEICSARGGPVNEATEVHHKYGRNSSLLFDVRGFVASCRQCRTIPHDKPEWARERGLLGAASLWGVPIDRHPGA